MKERKAPKFAAQVWGLVSVVLAFVVLGVTQVYGIDIVSDSGESIASNECSGLGGFWNTASQACQVSSTNTTALSTYSPGAAYNVSGDMVTAQSTISSNASNVSNIVMAGVVISIILAAFGGIALYRGMR